MKSPRRRQRLQPPGSLDLVVHLNRDPDAVSVEDQLTLGAGRLQFHLRGRGKLVEALEEVVKLLLVGGSGHAGLRGADLVQARLAARRGLVKRKLRVFAGQRVGLPDRLPIRTDDEPFAEGQVNEGEVPALNEEPLLPVGLLFAAQPVDRDAFHGPLDRHAVHGRLLRDPDPREERQEQDLRDDGLHSNLTAATGSMRAARRAGSQPATMLTNTENITEPAASHTET